MGRRDSRQGRRAARPRHDLHGVPAPRHRDEVLGGVQLPPARQPPQQARLDPGEHEPLANNVARWAAFSHRRRFSVSALASTSGSSAGPVRSITPPASSRSTRPSPPRRPRPPGFWALSMARLVISSFTANAARRSVPGSPIRLDPGSRRLTAGDDLRRGESSANWCTRGSMKTVINGEFSTGFYLTFRVAD